MAQWGHRERRIAARGGEWRESGGKGCKMVVSGEVMKS